MTKEARHNMILRAITDKAKSIIPPHSEVILFGSRARGDAREDSDWDVLILLDKDKIMPKDIDDYAYPLWELGLDYNESVNAILYTKKDWEHDIASPLVENVKSDGIKLWG